MGDGKDKTVRLPLRVLESHREGEAPARRATVHCPIHAGAIGLEHCRNCARLEKEVPGRALECAIPEALSNPTQNAGELVGAKSVCLDGELGVEEAAHVLDRAGLSAAPVVDDVGVVVGQVTAADLHRARLEAAEHRGFGHLSPTEVEDVMSAEPITVTESATLQEVARLMVERHVSSVVVVNARGETVGTIEALDVLRSSLSL